ncbi:MAG: hypothetical protein K6B75_00825 [Lachnospiraceae bacterium]|nr:hypothetical protein [Lachnospiraceae bacterium]
MSDRMPRDILNGSTGTFGGVVRKKFCYSYGETDYFRLLWERRLEEKRAEPAGGALKDRVFFVDPPDMTDGNLFDNSIARKTVYFISVFGRGQNVWRFLNEADEIAVFLTSDKKETESFFEMYACLVGKCFFFLECDLNNSVDEVLETMKRYNVAPERLCTLPKNAAFYEACERGNLEKFMLSNLYATEPENYLFMKQIRKAAKLLVANQFSEEGIFEKNTSKKVVFS